MILTAFFLFLDDELFSDTYKVTLTDNVLYEVVGKVRSIIKIYFNTEKTNKSDEYLPLTNYNES